MAYNIDSEEVFAVRDIDGELCSSVYDIDGNLLQTMDISLRHDVLFAQGNIVVRYDGKKLYRSMDAGKTFAQSVDASVVGTIKNIHVFTDGTLNVFGHRAAYYSDDWKTLKAATVLDSAGDPYVFDTYDTFTISRHNAQLILVDGVEMYVFGNYCITDERNQKKNVWYTTDKGHTYKSAYAFGTTSIRHVHNVYFYPADQSFWVSTGDTGGESKIIKGFYSPATDTWSWETLGSGASYKWAGFAMYQGWIYYSYDYTPGEVKRCRIEDVSDTSKHETVLDDLPNDCINIIIDDDTGEMLVGLSYYRSGTTTSPYSIDHDCRRLYYSTDRVNFDYVTGEIPEYYNYVNTMYYGMFGLTPYKKILAGLWSPTHEGLSNWDKVPSVWIDDIVRTKFPNAFRPPAQ